MPNLLVSTDTKSLEQFGANMKKVDAKVKNRVARVVEFHKEPATKYMKQNAPWTDRTGAARAGLHTDFKEDDNGAELVMAYTVYYGIWLEVRFSGAYGILPHTVEYIGDLIMARMKGLLQKMDVAEDSPPADSGTGGFGLLR